LDGLEDLEGDGAGARSEVEVGEDDPVVFEGEGFGGGRGVFV
jgi:hypothetical protein